MIRALYSLLMFFAQPWLRCKLAWRARRESGYALAVPERFGHYACAPSRGSVWVHAVSLGETRTAAILIEQLRQQLPGMRLLLTHGTASGRAQGAQLLRPGDHQVWQPWDSTQAVRRFLRHFQPRIGILLETEVWPNLVAMCQARQIPLVLANARLSEKSLRQAQRLACLARPAYEGLSAVWAQTNEDAQRLQQLGARVQGVFGNLKFDAAPDEVQCNQGRQWARQTPRPVVMLASSREGEEAAWLQVLRANQAVSINKSGGFSAKTQVQWLIVPRHPQRFDEVARLMEQHGLSVSRRSSWAGQRPAQADVWLGDSLGEMALYYSLSQVALLGGSFEPLGGQNLIEAAACGCPVVMGPHTYNFAQAAELALSAGAAQRAADMTAAVRLALELVNAPAGHQAAVQASQQFAARHRGAAQRTAQAVVELLGSATAPTTYPTPVNPAL